MSVGRQSLIERLKIFFEQNPAKLSEIRKHGQLHFLHDSITRIFDEIPIIPVTPQELDSYAQQYIGIINQAEINQDSDHGLDNETKVQLMVFQQMIILTAALDLLDLHNDIQDSFMALLHWNVATKQNKLDILSAYVGRATQEIQSKAHEIQQFSPQMSVIDGYCLNFINKNRGDYLNSITQALEHSSWQDIYDSLVQFAKPKPKPTSTKVESFIKAGLNIFGAGVVLGAATAIATIAQQNVSTKEDGKKSKSPSQVAKKLSATR